jgi:hypothetical protein
MTQRFQLTGTVRVRTRAEGLLARFAHDLELTGEATGTLERDGDAWSAVVSVPVASLKVAGVLKGDRVDTTVLSAGDRAEIERRISTDVFRGLATIRAEGRGTASGRATVTIAGPRSAAVPVQVTFAGDRANAEGVVSLAALGIAEVKAPLGAFRVRDGVEVRIDAQATAAS